MVEPLPHEASDERASALTAFALGELEGDEAARVDAWLQGDAEARLEAEQIRSLGARLTAEFAEEEAPGLTEQQRSALLAALEPAPEKIVRPLRWVRPLCALGVAAALTVFAGVMLLQEFRAPKMMTGLAQGADKEAPEKLGDATLESADPDPSVAMKRMAAADASAENPPAESSGLESVGADRQQAELSALPSRAGMDLATVEEAVDSSQEVALMQQPNAANAGAAEFAAATATADDGPGVFDKPAARLARRAVGKTAASRSQPEMPASIFASESAEPEPVWLVLQDSFLVPLWTSTASFDSLREWLQTPDSSLSDPTAPTGGWRAGDFVTALAQAAGPVSGASPVIRLRSALAPGTGTTWLVSVSAGISAEASADTPVEPWELRLEVDPERIESLRFVGYDRMQGDLESDSSRGHPASLRLGLWSGLLCELVPRIDGASGVSQPISGRPWLTVSLVKAGDAEGGEIGTAGLLTEVPVSWAAADAVLRAQTAGAALGLALETESPKSPEQLARWKAWLPESGGEVLGDLRAILDAAAGGE